MRATQGAAAIVGMALAASATGVGPAAAALPDQSSWLPEVRLSSHLQGPELARGVVTSKTGGAGAQIVVVAWPTERAMARLRVGDRVKLLPVAKAVADAAGRFALRLDPAINVADYTNPSGSINLDAFATVGHERSQTAFSRRLVAAADRTLQPASGLTRDLVIPMSGSGVPDDAVLAPEPLDKACISSLVQSYPNALTIVGEVYPGPHATGDFVYKSSAESTLGVGVSATGSMGSWSVGGTSTQSSTIEIGYPVVPANGKKVEQTYFKYGKFAITCVGKGYSITSYESRAYQFAGGSDNYNAAGTPSWTECTSYIAGTTPKITTHKAITFSNGVNISGAIGIDLSGSTGFTTEAKLAFAFATNGNLCGSNGLPGSAQRIIGR